MGASELNGGLDGYAHGDLGREAIDGKVVHAWIVRNFDYSHKYNSWRIPSYSNIVCASRKFVWKYKLSERNAIAGVFAAVLGADAALVRSQIFSGTHAIACALFGVLRPGDTMLAVSGPPYDTLEEVIGQRRPTEGSSSSGDDSYDAKKDTSEESPDPFAALPLDGNLKEWGIDYQEVNLTSDGYFNLPAIDAALDSNPKVMKRNSQYILISRFFIMNILSMLNYSRDRGHVFFVLFFQLLQYGCSTMFIQGTALACATVLRLPVASIHSYR